jgi:hypothetical protein
MTESKGFCYRLSKSDFFQPTESTPKFWERFEKHCVDIANTKKCLLITAIQNELKPYGGQLVSPNVHPRYLRFESKIQFTFFLLKWS